MQVSSLKQCQPSSLQRAIPDKPSILGVVEQYNITLRRSGREYAGHCPFHAEKTPSFQVNDDKGVFYCFGCGAKGDVFDFVMQIEGVDFKGALAHLGINSDRRPTRTRKSPERRAAETITAWASDTSLALSARMRVLTRGMPSEKVSDEYSCRQWAVLESLDDDLANPKLLPELWKQRDVVEAIIHGH